MSRSLWIAFMLGMLALFLSCTIVTKNIPQFIFHQNQKVDMNVFPLQE